MQTCFMVFGELSELRKLESERMEEAIHMKIESTERVWFKLLGTPKESEQKTIRLPVWGDGMSLGQVMKTSVFFDPVFFWLNHHQFLSIFDVPVGGAMCQDYTTGMFSQVNPVWPCLVGTVMVVIRLLTRCQFCAEHIWDTRLAQTNLIISINFNHLNQVYPQLDGNDRLPVPGFHRLKSILNVLKPFETGFVLPVCLTKFL